MNFIQNPLNKTRRGKALYLISRKHVTGLIDSLQFI